MSRTDPACFPECLAYREPDGEAKTRRLERLGDLHVRAKQARASRGHARIHYVLFMMSLTSAELTTLGIPQSAINRYCPQFHGDGTKHFSIENMMRDQLKHFTNPTAQTSRKRHRN